MLPLSNWPTVNHTGIPASMGTRWIQCAQVAKRAPRFCDVGCGVVHYSGWPNPASFLGFDRWYTCTDGPRTSIGEHATHCQRAQVQSAAFFAEGVPCSPHPSGLSSQPAPSEGIGSDDCRASTTCDRTRQIQVPQLSPIGGPLESKGECGGSGRRCRASEGRA